LKLVGNKVKGVLSSTKKNESRDRKEAFYENFQNKKLVNVLKKSVHFDIAKSLLIYINRCGLQVKAVVCHAGGHGFGSMQAHNFFVFF
jgi:hypothetical protein